MKHKKKLHNPVKRVKGRTIQSQQSLPDDSMPGVGAGGWDPAPEGVRQDAQGPLARTAVFWLSPLR